MAKILAADKTPTTIEQLERLLISRLAVFVGMALSGSLVAYDDDGKPIWDLPPDWKPIGPPKLPAEIFPEQAN